MSETTDHEREEYRYPGCKVGRRRETVKVGGVNGETSTLEEGKLVFHTVTREELLKAEEDGWWRDLHPNTDGEMGFDNVVPVAYDLEGIIWYPEPMTREEAGEWLAENREEWEQHLDQSIESDTTAEDLGIEGL